MAVPPDFSRLLPILLQTGLNSNNPPLYQFLKQLIEMSGQGQSAVSGTVTNTIGSAQFLTWGNNVATLPNSRQLLAGTNITFNDTIAGQRTINATGGGFPTVISSDNTILASSEVVAIESVEIADGIKFEIGDGAKFEVIGGSDDEFFYFVEIGADNTLPTIAFLWTFNISNIGDADWLVVNNAQTPGIWNTTAAHYKRAGGWLLRSHRWTNNVSASTFVNNISVTSSVNDDGFGAALGATSTSAFIGSGAHNTDGIGWQLTVPVSMRKMDLSIQTSTFSCDGDVIVTFSNPRIPSKTYTYIGATNGAAANSACGVMLNIVFWGPPCEMTVTMTTKNKTTTSPNSSLAFAWLRRG